MKVVGFNGSPRANGNTEILIQEALQGAADKGAETRIYTLDKLKIGGCKACYACKNDRRCIQQDDMQKLYDEIESADAIVFGSPIYMGHITGQSKIFMDRLYNYLMTPQFTSKLGAGKKAVLILAQGNPDTEMFRPMVTSFRQMMSMLGFHASEVIVAACGHDKGIITQNNAIMEHTRQAGAALIS